MNDLDLVRAFYQKVLPDCEKFYEKCPLNEFWGGSNLLSMRGIIGTAQSMTEVIHLAQRTFMFSVNVPDEPKRWAVEWLVRHMEENDRWCFVEESKFSLPDNNVEMDGKIYTPDLLRCANIATEIFFEVMHGAARPFTVFELGGGLGHLARVLKLSGVATKHVIVDLPETLVFSYCFLRSNFPEATFYLADSAMQSPGVDADFVFVPVAYAEGLVGKPFDLFLNTASMGEMRNETVHYWMNFVQNKLKPQYLFTLNRFLNTLGPGLAWRKHENECQQHFDTGWQILKWEIEPEYLRCPYVDTLVSRYVEIIAARERDSIQSKLSPATLAAVRMEDWWRLRHEGHVMGMRDNPICVDGTMDGTLFKLWELMRLSPSVEVVDMMLVYLSKLNRDPVHPFEELSYYENLRKLLLVQGRT